MLCTFCQGIRLIDLVAFETKDDDEIETCRLINTERAYHHHPNFNSLFRSAEHGCNLCLLISQVLEEKQSWHTESNIYGSIHGEAESDLVLKLRSACSGQIYVYQVDASERYVRTYFASFTSSIQGHNLDFRARGKPILPFFMLLWHVGATDFGKFLGKKMQEYLRLQLCQPSTQSQHYLQPPMLAQLHSFGALEIRPETGECYTASLRYRSEH